MAWLTTHNELKPLLELVCQKKKLKFYSMKGYNPVITINNNFNWMMLENTKFLKLQFK